MDEKKETALREREIEEKAYEAAAEILSRAGLRRGSLFVVGCSTSEVAGKAIGSFSSPELAEQIVTGICRALEEKGVFLAAQCCEHLNRALVMEEEAALKYGYERVCVIPRPKAGGSFASAAYGIFQHPVVVERIQAHAGMDIGDTLIGMHLKAVAVPLRSSIKNIGEARIIGAMTRPKYIGGSRAVYVEEETE